MKPGAGHELVRLPNGVVSIRSLAYGEVLHPSVGPVAEAQALYVEQLNLCERLRRHVGEFVVWDVGLGAAANAVTVLRATREFTAPLRLVSFDKATDQLEFALANKAALGYFDGYENELTWLMRTMRVEFRNGEQSADWELVLRDFPVWLSNSEFKTGTPAKTNFHIKTSQPLTRSSATLSPSEGEKDGVREHLEINSAEHYRNPKLEYAPHAILFDPHSPAKNPEMWTLPLFTNLFRLLDPQRPCALATYSRSTVLRVTLLLAGFSVGVGRASGRKEETTIAANTLELIANPLTREWLQRARRSDSAEPLREPVYSRAPLAPESWEKLRAHPQFSP